VLKLNQSAFHQTISKGRAVFSALFMKDLPIIKRTEQRKNEKKAAAGKKPLD